MSCRYKIELTYNGSEFHGWQRQPNAISVQQIIEDAISLLFKENIELVGCGRTDTGVHTKYYVAHFDCDTEFNSDIINKLNRYLPNTISIFSINKVSSDFHSRYNAKSRTYEYIISTYKDPFSIGFSWYIPQELNIELMNEAANLLLNYSDFTSFSKLHTDVKNNNCKISNAYFTKDKNKIIFTITADRFLRNMVRAIVGTLVNVGKCKISISDFCKIIETKNRCEAGQSAPAGGLFLVDVVY